MPLQHPDYLARTLGAPTQADIAGSFPTTPERLDRFDWDAAYAVLSDAAFFALIWVVIAGGGLALMDWAFRTVGAM